MQERLFLAVRPSAALTEQLARLQQELRRHAAFRHARWIPPQNLHLTLHFLGDVATAAIPALRAAIVATPIPLGFPTTQTFPELTGFPRPQSATVLVVGAPYAVRPLADLHELLKPTLLAAGIPPEARAYAPHLTLARFRNPIEVPQLDLNLDLALDLSSFSLYASTRDQNGSRYELLQDFPLSR